MVYRGGGGPVTTMYPTPGGCMQPSATQHALGYAPWVPRMLVGPARGHAASSMYRYKGTVGVGAGGQAWWCPAASSCRPL